MEGEILKDKWCGDEPLCATFPSLFVIVSSKELGWRMFGTRQKKGVFGPLAFLDS